ncbi:MAG: CoA transferase [Pseudomonadota bacterium]|nr:CoA transferase [Pseudomonadota bacterium]
MVLPLDHIRVLDLTRAAAGPFATMILGDLGADVVKVEPTPKGDMTRLWGPFDHGIGVYYLSINRNKRCLGVDFRNEHGLDAVRRMAAKADVVVENFKPGTAEMIGLGYQEIKAANTGVIYASISGFGRTGPYGKWPGLDQIAQGMSGMMSLTGQRGGEPTRYGVPIGDFTAGMWCALAVTAAVAQRHVTGEGQRVETSLLGALVGLLSVQGQRYLSNGDVPGQTGNDHPTIYPYGVFEAKDGPLNVATAREEHWQRLCKVMDIEELLSVPEYADNSRRIENKSNLRKILNDHFRTRDAIDWTKDLMEGGVPAGPVYSLDKVFNDPQVAAQGMVEGIDHPTIGTLDLLANPIKMEAFEGQSVRLPPPLIGEHNEQVLADYGFSAKEIADLASANAIGAEKLEDA